MKKWLVKELGEPQDVLKIEESDRPVIKDGEVIIEVKAAALNFFDILLCQGKYQEKPRLPFTICSEVSGVIIKTDEGSRFSEGQRVLGLPKLPNGGLADYVSVPETSVYQIPESMSWTEGAAMFITYHTSYYSLFTRGGLQKDEVLLVHAGAGGVGSAAIQLGKAAGAFVIATSGGPDKGKICKELGADVVIDYENEDFVEIVKKETNGKGANVIFDPVGGQVFDRSRKCIAFDGRILVIGFAGGEIPTIPANHVLIKNYSIVGVHWGLFNKRSPEKVYKEHEELLSLFEQGKIKPLIYHEYDFEDVPQALNLLASRKTWGKVVVKM